MAFFTEIASVLYGIFLDKLFNVAQYWCSLGRKNQKMLSLKIFCTFILTLTCISRN